MVIVVWTGLAVGTYLLGLLWRARRCARADAPTVGVADARLGRCAVVGRVARPVDDDQVLRAPISDIECAWWRVRTETGPLLGTQARASSSDLTFDLTDGAARVRVFPWGGRIEGTQVVSTKNGTTRVTEWVLPYDTDLYVSGTTSIGELPDAIEYRLADWDPVPSEAGERRGEPDDDALIVSVYGDSTVGLRLRATEITLFVVAAVLFAITIVLAAVAARPAGAWSWSPWLLSYVAVLGVAVVPARAIPIGYRAFAARGRATTAWTSIDEALARRALLVPPLTFAVRGGAPDEVEMITLLQSIGHTARSPKPSLADRIELIPLLVALTERQPQLRAVPNFDALVSQIQLAEDHVTLGQRFYNDAVETETASARTFSGSLVARLLPSSSAGAFTWYTPKSPRTSAPA